VQGSTSDLQKFLDYHISHESIGSGDPEADIAEMKKTPAIIVNWQKDEIL
jgi:calcineurin-like phosphoesterase family protein